MSLDVYLECECCETELFSGNITHNLWAMADAAGVYEACWRPEEIGITRAHQLTPLLRPAIARLRTYPELFQQFDSPNGWGLYVNFVPWLEEYADACERYPNAKVRASR